MINETIGIKSNSQNSPLQLSKYNNENQSDF